MRRGHVKTLACLSTGQRWTGSIWEHWSLYCVCRGTHRQFDAIREPVRRELSGRGSIGRDLHLPNTMRTALCCRGSRRSLHENEGRMRAPQSMRPSNEPTIWRRRRLEGRDPAVGAVSKKIPVNFTITGCPRRPLDLVQGLVALFDRVTAKTMAKT